MSRSIDINPEIIEVLKSNKIRVADGVSALVLMYHNLKPTYLDKSLTDTLFTTGLVSFDYTSNSFSWKYPLYENSHEDNYDWIGDWMDLFKKSNPERRGTKAAVVKRMKDFFANNPKYTVENVFNATRQYLRSVTDPKYVKTSHKFIKEQDGSSKLLEQLEVMSTSSIRVGDGSFNDTI